MKEEPVALLDLISTLKADLPEENRNEELQLTGAAIAQAIKTILHRFNLNFQTLVGQGYDGAASMSSERVGVAANIKNDAPLADYFHCAMHALNLSCSRAVSVTDIRHAEDVAREVISFFSSAKRNNHFVEIVKSDAPPATKTHLLTLCTTRFVERHTAVVTLWDLLPYVVTALEKMQGWKTQSTGYEARTLKNSILKADFLIGLICLKEVSALLRPVSFRIAS